jgi:hypothetical protein
LDGPLDELVGDPACRRETDVQGAAACFARAGDLGCGGTTTAEWCLQREMADGWQRLTHPSQGGSPAPFGWELCTADVSDQFGDAPVCM